MNLFLLCPLILGGDPAPLETSVPVAGQGTCTCTHDVLAPIGVMGDHTHAAGEWMVSVRAMRMHMDGLRDGRERVSEDAVLADYIVTPTSMDMDMLMLGAMVALADDWSLMLMVPWVSKSMDHRNRMNVRFTTEASGLGDVSLTSLHRLSSGASSRLHAGLGLSVPTGSIDEHDDTPAGNAKLPYPMQLGSGTFDLVPSLTWSGWNEQWSWGAQGRLTLRTGENSEDYRLGNRVEAGGWVARDLGSWHPSLRLLSTSWSDVHGADPELAGGPSAPMKLADLQDGHRVDLLLGIDRQSASSEHRFALELGVPIYQKLDGPQLETDWTLSLGWQWSL